MKYFQKLGMPPSKMMLGLGTYGRGDTPAMPYTGFKGESGFVAYYEVNIKYTFFFKLWIGISIVELYSNCL